MSSVELFVVVTWGGRCPARWERRRRPAGVRTTRRKGPPAQAGQRIRTDDLAEGAIVVARR